MSKTGNLNRLLFIAFLGEIFSTVLKIDFKVVQRCVCIICFYCPVNIFSDPSAIEGNVGRLPMFVIHKCVWITNDQ